MKIELKAGTYAARDIIDMETLTPETWAEAVVFTPSGRAPGCALHIRSGQPDDGGR